MKRLALLLLPFLAVPLAGSATLRSVPVERFDPATLERLPQLALARATADSITAGTRALLMQEIAAHGTARALTACGTMALQEALRHEQEGWRVRRVSSQWRNPMDAPDGWESKALRRFEGLRKRGTLTPQTEWAEVVTLDGQPTLRYLRAVTIPGELCL